MMRQFYKFKPIGRKLGAEILDFDLLSHYDPNNKSKDLVSCFPKNLINQIKTDLLNHRVLVFREQKTPISGQAQVDFSNSLGTIISTTFKPPTTKLYQQC